MPAEGWPRDLFLQIGSGQIQVREKIREENRADSMKFRMGGGGGNPRPPINFLSGWKWYSRRVSELIGEVDPSLI